MDWHELGRARSGAVAPDFALVSGAGETITRGQFRQRSHLVLFFVPSGGSAAADRLTERGTEFDEASARAFVVQPAPDPASAAPLLLVDPDGRTRAAYAGLFPQDAEPDQGDSFAVVLDRYGTPWYTGRGAVDDAAIDEALTKLWAIEYDCPE